MEMFDNKNSKRIEYLEEERRKLWERLLILEQRIEEKTSDFEKEAKQSSKKVSEFRNKAETRLSSILELEDRISKLADDLNSKLRATNIKYDQFIITSDKLLSRSQLLQDDFEKLENVFENHPNLDEKISELESNLEEISDINGKSNTLHKNILSKKTDIDEIHREIIGYNEKKENGEVIEINGLKVELETIYTSLQKKSETLNNDIISIREESEKMCKSFIEENNNKLVQLHTESDKEYEEVLRKIENLLPTAMTAGLSSAFVKKKNEEEKLYEDSKKGFENGIIFMSLAALAPIALNIYFLVDGISINEVISRSPKVILSFLPLYIPLLWRTISANKRVNLSKRLIEEYSHKQVLSMTIEGLSKQITKITDQDISEELRIKLITNFLEVSNENPGKLISDYQRSDNPLLNLIDTNKNASEKTISKKREVIFQAKTNEIEDKEIVDS